jgi:hypothetical protein
VPRCGLAKVRIANPRKTIVQTANAPMFHTPKLLSHRCSPAERPSEPAIIGGKSRAGFYLPG